MEQPVIDSLSAAFFDLFTNTAGRDPDWSRIDALCLPQAVFIKKEGLETTVYPLDGFVAPRRQILSDGTLTAFSEWETSAETRISGHLAQRFSRYRKRGVLNGRAFEQSGCKLFQFVKTAGGWRISSVVWEDDQEPPI